MGLYWVPAHFGLVAGFGIDNLVVYIDIDVLRVNEITAIMTSIISH